MLVAADDVGHARLVAVGIALGGLLEQRVKTQQREIARALAELRDVGLRLFELILEVAHLGSVSLGKEIEKTGDDGSKPIPRWRGATPPNALARRGQPSRRSFTEPWVGPDAFGGGTRFEPAGAGNDGLRRSPIRLTRCCLARVPTHRFQSVRALQ
ncbi:protein of unknown function [Pararobbsia alpina]